ncbi:MAG: hypothetical protein ACXWWQ_07755 [Candidatus Limnocylindria bacterium]
MDTILGLFGMAIWIAGTISIAAGITYLVVKIDERLKASRSRS